MIQVDESKVRSVPRTGEGPRDAGPPNRPRGDTSDTAPPDAGPALEDAIVFVSPPPAPFPRIFPGL
jgi:hypothetical protein